MAKDKDRVDKDVWNMCFLFLFFRVLSRYTLLATFECCHSFSGMMRLVAANLNTVLYILAFLPVACLEAPPVKLERMFSCQTYKRKRKLTGVLPRLPFFLKEWGKVRFSN